MKTIALGIVVYGIAVLLLTIIYKLYRNKKISGKRASIFATSVFIARGVLITSLSGSFLYNLYGTYIKTNEVTTETSLDAMFQKEKLGVEEKFKKVDELYNEEKRKINLTREDILKH